MGLLARREYSTAELTAALLRKGFHAGAVTEAVAMLTGERLLDDVRYADSLVRKLAGRGQGPTRVRAELVDSGLAETLVEAALEGGPDFRALAIDVRRRRFGTEIPSGWPERARQMRFLQYRGFTSQQISAALGGAGMEALD